MLVIGMYFLFFLNAGVRLYHSMTSVPGWGAVIIGGRTSPLNPIDDILRVTYLTDEFNSKNMLVSMEKMVCTGTAPKPRWRHTVTLLSHGGKDDLLADTLILQYLLTDSHCNISFIQIGTTYLFLEAVQKRNRF